MRARAPPAKSPGPGGAARRGAEKGGRPRSGCTRGAGVGTFRRRAGAQRGPSTALRSLTVRTEPGVPVSRGNPQRAGFRRETVCLEPRISVRILLLKKRGARDVFA